jgi:LPXTG-motif cell wall-anchored protein
LTPVTSQADTAPSGLAKASSLSLTLSPQALAVLALPPQLQSTLQSLPCGVGNVAQSALTQTTTLALDSASNDGTLNSAATDLVSGEATSEAVHIGLQGIDQVLGMVKNLLNGKLDSCLTGSQVTLPVNVQDLLNTLQGQLSGVTNQLNGTLGQLGGNLNINRALHVGLDQQPQSSDALDLSAPLVGTLQLAPFDAVAVSQNGANQWHVPSGPQLEAHNTTTNLAIGQSIPLGSLENASGTISGLISTIQGDLTSITTQLSALQGNGVTGQVVTAVCTTVSSLLPVNCSQLPISTDPSQAVSTLTSQLTSLQSALNNLLGGLPSLQNLLGRLPSSINLADLLSTAGDTSSVLTQPQKSGVHSIATTSFADLKVLQLLSNVLPGLPNAPLIELKGISSSAEAFVNGTDATPPSGTVSLGELDVLGHAIPLQGVGTSRTVPIAIPGLGTLTAVVSIGQPQQINNTLQRKTEQAAALHVQLINGDPSGGNVITALGVKQDPTIVDLTVAGTQVDDSMTPVAGVQATSTSLPSTGMVGPVGFAAVGLLALTSAGLRLAARRNRRAADIAELPLD